MREPEKLRSILSTITPADFVTEQIEFPPSGKKLVDTRVRTQLVSQICDFLTTHLEIRLLPGLGVHYFGTWSALDYAGLAASLAVAARNRGVDAVIEELDLFCRTSEVQGVECLGLRNIGVESTLTIGNKYKLIPYVYYNPSDESWDSATVLTYRNQDSYLFPDAIRAVVFETKKTMFRSMSCILIREATSKPVLMESGSPQSFDNHIEEFEDIVRILSILGTRCPTKTHHWYEPKSDAPLPEILTRAYAGTVWFIVQPNVSFLKFVITKEMEPSLNELWDHFCHLDRKLQGRIRISGDRLNRAMRQNSVVDEIFDLTISIEVMLLGDSDRDLAFAFRSRAAWYLGEMDFNERIRINDLMKFLYEQRSVIVHTGKIKGDPDVAITKIKDCYAIAAKALIKIINTGQPDWNKVVLGI